MLVALLIKKKKKKNIEYGMNGMKVVWLSVRMEHVDKLTLKSRVEKLVIFKDWA